MLLPGNRQLWTSNPNLHSSLVDTTFYLFAFLFAIFLVCLLAYLLASLFLCLPCLLRLSALCLFICTSHLSLPLLVCWFFIFAFACTQMEQGRMELRHGFPGTSKKGCKRKHVDLSQAVVASRFRSQVFPFWLCTLLNPFLPPPVLP